jgi:nucleoid DNA-binding protein
MITSYIQELLSNNNRVIIPNYGAFLVRATSKGKDSNKLEDKLSDIYFSPFLKFNDELLERYIVKKEGITKDLAGEKIKLFIEEVKNKLNSDSVYDIKNFGQFTMDKQGKVLFNPVSVEKTNIEKESETPKEETKKETKKSMAKTPKEPAKKAPAKTKTPKEPEKELVIDVKPDSIPVKEEIKPEIKEEVKPIVKTEVKQPIAPPKPEIKFTSKKKESSINKGLVWSIAIGLPLAAIFIWALLNFDTVNKILKKDAKQAQKIEKTAKTEPEKVVAEEVKAEPTAEDIIEQKVKTEQAKTATTQAASNVKKYYIIAGSFKKETYADSYLKSLQEKGFPAERLAERNGMYAVSYYSFTDKAQALAEYRVITQEKGLTAWILYY